MLTYDYGCDGCGHTFERAQRITEEPIRECPRCGGASVRRLLSVPTFILKGGGWYADGYAHRTSPSKETAPP